MYTNAPKRVKLPFSLLNVTKKLLIEQLIRFKQLNFFIRHFDELQRAFFFIFLSQHIETPFLTFHCLHGIRSSNEKQSLLKLTFLTFVIDKKGRINGSFPFVLI
jgi:uncharacterized protein YueI